MNRFQKIKELIETNNQIYLFHHIRPDGDCLGAAFGLQALIQTNYPHKKVSVIGNNHHLFTFLQFEFANSQTIQLQKEDLVIILDVNNYERIENGDLLELEFNNLIRIDHHNNIDNLKAKNKIVIDQPDSAATCQIISALAIAADWKISSLAATYLYLGIYTDTNRFLYDYTSATTLEMSAILWKFGAEKNLIHSQLQKRKLSDIKITSFILQNYEASQKVIWFYMDSMKQKKLGILSPLDANFPNTLANINDYEIWVYFTEESPNQIRCEFRSNQVDVKTIAEKWNGGGHLKASGCSLASASQIPAVIKACNQAILTHFTKS